ncbi:MAG: thiosulfate oxidation carrier protein SoxY [Devosia sp.]
MKLTRRSMCLGALSLAALAGAWPALATEADVRAAIADDFGPLPELETLPDGGISIELPEFSDSGKSVPLTVSVPASMTGRDYPEIVAVYAARNPRPRVCRVFFTPACAEARFSTRIRIDSYQDVTIMVRMADGRVFRAVRKVDVTYGACEDPIANEQFPPGWSPSMRVSVPKVVITGSEAEIRTIIGHPMETGFRHNIQGLLIPVRIAETFRCMRDGETLFSVKLEPAIAANPYFAFALKAEASADLRFEWDDTTGELYATTAELVVA